ncbi:hypothetical protein Tco_1425420 [Tanacetum coccineum]
MVAQIIPPARTDSRLSLALRVKHRKSQPIFYNAQRFKRNPSFRYQVDILSNTTLLSAIINTASVNVPAHLPATVLLENKYYYILGNLNVCPKVSQLNVFGMAIPDPLNNGSHSETILVISQYSGNVAENTKKTPQESAQACKLQQSALQTPKKAHNHTTTQTIPKPAPLSQRRLPSLNQESIPQEEDGMIRSRFWLRLRRLSLEAHQEREKKKGNDADLESELLKLSLDPRFVCLKVPPVGGVTIRTHIRNNFQTAMKRDQTPHDSTTGPSSQHEDDTSKKVIHESSSTSDSERTKSETEAAALKGDKDQDEVDTSTVTSGVSIADSRLIRFLADF